MRKLIYIPNIHPEGEGTAELTDRIFLNDSLAQSLVSKRQIAWGAIKRGVTNLTIDSKRTKLFAEGITEDELRLNNKSVRQKAKQDLRREGQEYPTLELAISLIDKGAKLAETEGGESYTMSEFLSRNLFKIYKRLKESDSSSLKNETPQNLEATIQDLDKYGKIREKIIAKNINQNLKEGETGILIIGMGHYHLLDELDQDIKITYVDPELEELDRELREILPQLGSSYETFQRVLQEKSIQSAENKG